MKRFLKRIQRLWCKHDEFDFEVRVDIIAKLKNTKNGYCWRYDVWENRYCPHCSKLLDRTKVKSDLTSYQLMFFTRDRYGHDPEVSERFSRSGKED